jgi:hypothetical protein
MKMLTYFKNFFFSPNYTRNTIKFIRNRNLSFVINVKRLLLKKVISELIKNLVLGVIDWVGRPDSRSQPKSGRVGFSGAYEVENSKKIE